MSFFSQLQTIRPELEQALNEVLTTARREGTRFVLDEWLLAEAARRVTKGKLLRGGLVVAAYEAYGGSDRRAAVQAAAALELYGTGILMQDDVIDHSATRRGLPTIHVLAAEKAAQDGMKTASAFGTDTAICLGDTLYFLAQERLATVQADPALVTQLQALSARELWLLGLAQMEDIRLSLLPDRDATITEDQILEMYAGKTGRYSVAWPCQTGALLAGAPAAEIKLMADIGTQFGVLYQIQDDELGLFGNPAETGKPADDDIREGKKTLFWFYLAQQLPAEDNRWHAFGNEHATSQEVDALRQYIRASGVEEHVHSFALERQVAVRQQLAEASITTPAKELLAELLNFVVTRKK